MTVVMAGVITILRLQLQQQQHAMAMAQGENLDSDGSHDHRRPCWRYTIWDYRVMILKLVGDLLLNGG